MDSEDADFPVQPRFQDDEETGEIGQREDKADRAPSEIGGEEEDDDDDESGEDLMKSKGNVVGSDDEDSSEEEDDDPEEARRIAEGFIVDEDEEGSDEESKRRRRKARRRRKRQEEEEEENEQLDEDDLDLLAENTGIKRKQRQLKRFRRASVSPDAMEQDQASSRKPRDLQHMFDDDDEDIVAPRRATARGGDEYDDDDDEDMPAVGDALRAQSDRRGRDPVPYNYEDEMEDFIDDDDESEMDEAMSEGEREARREEKRAKRKAELEERRARRDGRFGFDPSRAGIDAEAWAELNDVFGDGQEYERFLSASEDEAEPEEGGDEELADGSKRKTKAKVKTFEDIFEPSAIQARMMTLEDQRIREADFPERFQVLLPGDEGEALLERRLNEEELVECTRWVSHRFSFRSNKSFLSESGEFYEYRDAWFACVRSMVEQIINLRREAMYLYAHRIDEYELRRGDRIIDLLQRRDFSALVSACLKFKTLLARRDSLRDTFNQFSDDGGEFVSAEDRGLFEQLLQRTESTDEVADVADWLTMRYGQRMRDAQARRDTNYNKRPTVIGQYDQLKSTTVAPFSTKFSISSSQLAENLVGQSRAYFTEDEELTPVALADQYIGVPNGPSSVHNAIESARRLLAHEIGRDPTIKREARTLLRTAGLLSVKPTDRGQYKIDEEHPYYNFKFLLRKPIADFKVVLANEKLPSPAQYLMILRAEEELLVESELIVRETDARAFEQKLYDMYCSEGMSETSRLWNDERKQIIRQALQDHLYPAAKLWAKEWLRDECWEFIGRACEVALTKRIDCQPYQSRSMKARKELQQKQLQQPYGRDYEDDDDEDELKQGRDNVPKVLAVSNGKGDPRKDEIEMVFLDSGGRLRERVAFETLDKPREVVNDSTNDSQQKEEKPDPSREFKQLLKERRPDVIVISGFSPKAVSLRKQIQDLVQENLAELQDQNLTQEQIDAATIDVIHIHDDVARLYQHSDRAKEEYPSLNTMSRYCLALARYAQSPVQEFAALKQDDLLALRYDAYQHLIPRERLALFLERALVAIVNTICVDINRCSIDTYYASLLRFVSGLGPRKADALMRAINTQLGGYVVNRNALTVGAADSEMLSRGDSVILPNHVWHNACSFLIIRPRQDPRTARKVKMQGSADALDRTRIHPEAYEYARFIAFDALRKTEEDRLPDQHPSQWCDELMRDEGRRAKLEDIDMADYERNLWAEMARQGQKRERKLSMLEFIARELVEPLHEQRKDFVLPTVDEVLVALSGETRATFDDQKIVTVQVRNILRDMAIVQLESGIEGTIHKEYLLPRDSSEYGPRQVPRTNELVKHGQTLNALIINVDMENLRAELSARPSHVEEARAADAEKRKTEVDLRYFDRELAEMERDQAERTRQKRQNANRGTRFIRHPDFHNFKAGQAEEYLANAPRGSAVVRPSSKGDDYLAVTWKVDEGVYQHVEVQELDKDPQQEIGRILRVTNIGGSSYSDIDELLVNHVTPMARMVDMLMNHEKYHGTEDDLNKFLTNFSLANPTRSQYGFAIDKKRPGLFVLGFKANREAPIQRWPVRILPGRYKLNEAEVPDMVSLCNAFKTQYTTRAMRSGAGTSNNLPGGRTPGHALPGGMTPGIGMRTGGMTPRVGGGAGVGGYTPRTGVTRPAGALGGATPYGTGMTAATPNPYAYGRSDAPRPPGAPPMRPGPPPSRPPPAYPPGPPPSKSNASGGIHPDRMRQMGEGGALNGRNGGGHDSYRGGGGSGWD
ncbi:uncharacterized protein FA14DRAFT_160784 [Meira miltonrushii]|uniref:S1 motif domain-containing protein n=1 Tax=Meira miltonrushii TaxID=1280837 RepID=A0A316VFD0_9BASI|nr:uncharacterized protein FA14DRAFT_160784 [Meira miltonrushii]PWN35768.1 hypothetical protein FA14DRAFT_160784 [Meira miltonrushii]